MKKAIAVLAVLALSGAAYGDTIIHNNLQGAGYAWVNGWGSSVGGDNLFGGRSDYAVVDRVTVPAGFNKITSVSTTSISSQSFFFGGAPILATQATLYIIPAGDMPNNFAGNRFENVSVTSTNIGFDGYGIAMVQMDWTGSVNVAPGTYYIGLRAFSTAGEPNEWYYQHDAPAAGDAYQASFDGPFGSLGGGATSLRVGAVPAPASLALVGLGGLVAARRRR